MHALCKTFLRTTAPLVCAVLASGWVVPVMAQTGSQPVEIRFVARVGSEPARCDRAYTGVGEAKAGLRFQDLRIYVSALRLLGSDGHEVPVTLTPDGQWQSDQVVLLDFENRTGNCNGNAATNSVVRGTVPAGTYRGLVFEIGVPKAINHQDPTLAAAPLNVTALTWPWRIGYKFTTIDLETSGGAAGLNHATGFSIHLGSTECGEGNPLTPPSAPCGKPNRPTYRLEGFDPKSSNVVLDLGALLAETDITVNAPKTASGCMSFPGDADCTAIMNRLGLPFDGHPSAGQKWVRAE
jgi:uncharacterized repeat protein (TIGR04052 family)